VTSPFRNLLVVTSAVLVLGACSAGGTPTGDLTPDATTAQRETQSGRPSVGDCWQEDDYATARMWESWLGADPIDCQGPHNTITMAVVDLPADMKLATGTQTDDERRELNGLCVPPYQVVMSADPQARLGMSYYQPSPEQVASGQRWVRCDIALRALGPMSEHKYETLPPTVNDLMAALTADPVRYALCVNTPWGNHRLARPEPSRCQRRHRLVRRAVPVGAGQGLGAGPRPRAYPGRGDGDGHPRVPCAGQRDERRAHSVEHGFPDCRRLVVRPPHHAVLAVLTETLGSCGRGRHRHWLARTGCPHRRTTPGAGRLDSWTHRVPQRVPQREPVRPRLYASGPILAWL
jgi:hypothetical protein